MYAYRKLAMDTRRCALNDVLTTLEADHLNQLTVTKHQVTIGQTGTILRLTHIYNQSFHSKYANTISLPFKKTRASLEKGLKFYKFHVDLLTNMAADLIQQTIAVNAKTL